MDYNLNSELQEYLKTNEKLIWAGQPKKGIVFRKSDLFMIPFNLLWCGFAIFWVFMALKIGAPIYFAMFGIPFVIMGLIFVFGRFFIDARLREHTVYGLTAERILIKTGVKNRNLQSINISTIFDMKYEEKSDGSGSIIIGPSSPVMMWGNTMNKWSGTKVLPMLELIEDVRSVYDKIMHLRKISK